MRQQLSGFLSAISDVPVRPISWVLAGALEVPSFAFHRPCWSSIRLHLRQLLPQGLHHLGEHLIRLGFGFLHAADVIGMGWISGELQITRGALFSRLRRTQYHQQSRRRQVFTVGSWNRLQRRARDKKHLSPSVKRPLREGVSQHLPQIRLTTSSEGWMDYREPAAPVVLTRLNTVHHHCY